MSAARTGGGGYGVRWVGLYKWAIRPSFGGILSSLWSILVGQREGPSRMIFTFWCFEKAWWWVFLGAGSIPQFFRDTLFLFSASGLGILWSLYLCDINLSFSLFRRKLLDAYSYK